MISYKRPDIRIVRIGEHIEGIGEVNDTSDGTPTLYERLRDAVPIPAQNVDTTGMRFGCGVCGQMRMFQREPTREELMQLTKDMWHCIQVTPMAPPALKESIRQRVEEYGIPTE